MNRKPNQPETVGNVEKFLRYNVVDVDKIRRFPSQPLQRNRDFSGALRGEWAFSRSVLVLGGLAIIVLGPLLLHLTAPGQIDYSEGWNVMRQMQVAKGIPLYATPPHLDETNYPPLSFHLIAILAGFFGGDFNLTGRVTSSVALAALAGLAGWLAKRMTGSRSVGLAAGLVFLLAFALWMPGRVAENDPQPPGMALEMLGFCLVLRSRGRGAGFYASALLFALAVFFKPNLMALPLGVGLALLVECAWGRLAAWVGIGLVTSLALYDLALRVDGPYFLSHLLGARAYSLHDAWHQAGDYILIWLPFIFLGGLWSWQNRHEFDGRVLGSAWLAAQVLGCIFAGGDGVAQNIFFEALWLDAVLAVVALAALPRIWPVRGRRVSFPLLAASFLLPLQKVPGTMIQAVGAWQTTPQRAVGFAEGVAILRAASGPVVCDNLLLCVEAGKPSYFDPYFLRDQMKIGRMPSDAMSNLVLTGTLGAVEIGDTNQPVQAKHRYERFPAAFFAALPMHYRIVLHTPVMTIWLRRGETAGVV